MPKTKKTIWLINQYASTPETGMGGRHYYLARELFKQGFEVYLITASYTHLLREPPQTHNLYEISKENGFSIVWVKTPYYREAHSKQRVINWLLFAWRIRKLKDIIPDKPDAIAYSSPTLVGFLGAESLSRHFNVPLTFELRDVWPLTLTEIGGHSPRHPFMRFLRWIEQRAYSKSDHIISNLKNVGDQIESRGCQREKLHWIPNGISLEEVAEAAPLSSETEGALPNSDFIVGYAGTIGAANALETLVNAAFELNGYDDIHFVIVGNGGEEKTRLQSLIHEKSIRNITFIEPIPKRQIQTMLNRFDACYLGWLNSPLYRFGIGANKIPEYLYSGKPIVHAYSGECDPVSEYNAGITVPAEEPSRLANAILTLYRMSPEERSLLGKNGHKAAIENLDFEKLAKEWSDVALS